MGRIQSSVGLVTGVAIDDTVDQLMGLNAVPRDRLVSRTTQLQQEQTAVTELMTQIVGLQLSTDRLGQDSLYSATSVTSSKSDVLTAKNTGSAKLGSYSFIPVRQAQSQQLTSSLYSSSAQKLTEGEIVIHQGGFLDESVSLDELNGGAGVSRGAIRITDRSGASQKIDLRFAENANDVVDAINSNDALGIVASLEGDHFVLKDISGATLSNLKVEDVDGGTTARDLGLSGISTTDTTAEGRSVQTLAVNTSLRSLLDGRGIDLPSSGAALKFSLKDGTSFSLTSEIDTQTGSVGQLLDEINAAGNGKVEAQISTDGKSVAINDLTSGSASFTISSPQGDLAAQLGLDVAASGGTITGDHLIAGLSDTLLDSLSVGGGYPSLGDLDITNRAGSTTTIDLSGARTLHDVIDTINDASAGVTAQLNRTKTGIEILDTTGSTSHDLVIADGDATDSASKLQIEGAFAKSSVDSGSLNKKYVTRSTSLQDFNHGQEFPLGAFKITDSAGKSVSLNLSTRQPETIGNVIDEINKLGIGVEARLNETGDGLLLLDTANGSGSLTVSDVGNSSSAKTLGIAGTSSALTVGGTAAVGIDGAQTIRIKTDSETTLANLAEQINALGSSPVNANILNLNSSGGVRLMLNSTSSGAQGRVALDSDIGITFSETTRGQNALLAFGANGTSGGVLVSSATNTFDGIVEDVQFTIADTSTSPVTVTVSENTETISKQVEAFVTQFNKMRDKLDSLTVFDVDTNSVGVLFGSSSALRVDLGYGRLLSGAFRGAGDISSLREVGIQLNENGKLDFDKEKFSSAIAKDPGAVKEFFTTEDSGFAAKAKALADSLASVETGSLLNRSNSLQSQIEQNNKRIESFNTRLDKQRTRLLTQFYNMEQTIAKLQQNLTSINGLQIIPPLGS
ncbi:flagellar filament capping protein FliD [Aureliella helgolandensis]|uniref:Filament cap protein n=1 Tax=Aureliella helgolandensis TaxID=2527968 RepID=A0A518G508_9BACT|nr:flagellar filament capping protein FliD [Aureliella helgolandensis]QDV23681.1 Flagellar hook-associated protein 2 [Aureliella helgolandensis]